MFKPWVLIGLVLGTAALVRAGDEGRNRYDRKEYTQARQFYESILQEHGDRPGAHYGLGASVYQLKDYAAAREAFERALPTADRELKAKLYYNLGNSFYQEDRLEESLAFYRQALELNPDDGDAKYNYEMVRYRVQPPPQQGTTPDSSGGESPQDSSSAGQDQPGSPQDSSYTGQDQPESSGEPGGEDGEEENRTSENAATPPEQEGNESQPGEPAPEGGEQDTRDRAHAVSILEALEQDQKILPQQLLRRASKKVLEKDW